ncbi:hypothetical protein [Demequina sediminicola]|uniref:hypothetical protein n=1 Tax=Demequina sediminicola TaxID=1095026 RepID=UPI00128D72B9|nr:hypothetical protein [Demequina sediminicola]
MMRTRLTRDALVLHGLVGTRRIARKSITGAWVEESDDHVLLTVYAPVLQVGGDEVMLRGLTSYSRGGRISRQVAQVEEWLGQGSAALTGETAS